MRNLFYTLSLLWVFALTAQAQSYEITFQVDMTDFIDDGGTIDATGMHVAGSWQAAAGLPGDWSPGDAPLTDNGDGTWSATFTIPEGTYEYKYVLGNDWAFGSENITGACGPGNGNREVVVDADKTVAFCYDACTDCGVAIPTVSVTFQVDMNNMITQFGMPSIVSVAGAFQGWSPGSTVMTDDDGDGIYTVTVDEVNADNTFQYKFIFGDDWPFGESVPAACNVGGNREFSTGSDDMTLDVVCFGTCDQDCPALGDPFDVTFLVDLSNEIPSADGIHLAGTIQFPAWQKADWEMLDDDGNGVYSIRVENVYAGEYQFKYINGDEDAEEEMADFIAGGCGVDNGIGGSNRVIALNGDTTIAFVYNSCDEITINQTDVDNAPSVVLGPVNVNNTSIIESYELFPNPMVNQAVLNFSNPNSERFIFTLTDMTGQVVRFDDNMTGEQIIIRRDNLPSGMYFATLRDRTGGMLTLKLLVQ